MDAVRKDVRRLVNKELEAANKRSPSSPARTRDRMLFGKSWKKRNGRLCH